MYRKDRINAMVGHNFPDFIEKWNRETFRKVGYGLAASTIAACAITPFGYGPAVVLGAITAGYWHVGLRDIRQNGHAIRRNYPVLGNIRYILETLRPELHQYIVESDSSGKPFDRMQRTQIYQRAKNVDDTMPFGTRRHVYEEGYEWACHSMWPKELSNDVSSFRTRVGCEAYGTTQPYDASVLNISGMSYGAISDNAILALSTGAKMGKFMQNTGEGGVSRFHLEGGGDLVWNIGTGYFGCGTGEGHNRVFDPSTFQEMIDQANGQVKMIEVKLSQGAKPGHGGLLPKAKITKEIAFARKLPFPPDADCHSPARHSSFGNAYELIEFLAKLRELSGGLPVGIKMCVGEPGDVATLCKAIVETGSGPDFITVDGSEGGTGAAPPELSNHMGMPLEEGLVLVRNMLVGAGLRDNVKINASGRVSSAFSLVRTIALGADYTSAARAFMMSLGCIQALKCNTNKCPTGIATLNKDLMYGLDPQSKSHRVFNYHTKTVKVASEIVGIIGKDGFHEVNGDDIMRRVRHHEVKTLSEHFPEIESESLLKNSAPKRLQDLWDGSGTKHVSTRRWIY